MKESVYTTNNLRKLNKRYILNFGIFFGDSLTKEEYVQNFLIFYEIQKKQASFSTTCTHDTKF